MKRMKRGFWKAALTAALLLFGSKVVPAQAAETTESYWSETNAPVIYGASGITIPKGTEFRTEDIRFRTFAKDFEDGDLSQQLTVTGTVDWNQAGNYKLTYSVQDSHGNNTTAEVPVTVVEETESDIIVKRTMYTTPSVWNMELAGTNRCNRGDRQHLGIFMPESSSIEIRLLEGVNSLTVECFNDDMFRERSRYRGGGFEIRAGGDWVNVTNLVQVKEDGESLTHEDHANRDNLILTERSYDSIPFVATPTMGRGEDINKTVTIEVKYGKDVKELNYYLHGDNEEAFRTRWNQEQHSFGVIESEVMTLVVPYIDLIWTTNYYDHEDNANPNMALKDFSTLDELCNYWNRVINKMDDMLGLEFNPEDPIDQNVRTHYFVRMNYTGYGMAYYWGSHIGYNNYGQKEGRSMANFFLADWCGLHEVAHGYQGSLGGDGNMALGEVGNNILCHYVQKNRELYPYEESWIGDFTQNENRFNENRLSTGEWRTDHHDEQLYMILNLFDYLEEENTYRNLWKWYRRQLRDDRRLTQSDAFAEGLAETYQVNIIPYLEAWGLEVSQETRDKVYEMNHPIISILDDMVSDETRDSIMEDNGITEKFEIVSQDIYKDVTGSCTISITIDSLDAIKGKTARIMDGKTLVKEVAVDGSQVQIDDIPVGIYTLQMPASGSYSCDAEYVTIKEGENSEIAVAYESLIYQTIKNGVASIQVQGITHGIPLLALKFDETYTTARMDFIQNGNTGSEETYIKVYNASGEAVATEEVIANGTSYNFDMSKADYDITIAPGYVIEVHHPHTHRVKVDSLLTGIVLNELLPTEATTRYVVYEDGIRKESMSVEETEDAFYAEVKEKLEEIIDNYRNTATEEVLSDPYSDRKAKEEVLNAYHNLKEEDQEAYLEFIQKIGIDTAAIPVFSLAEGEHVGIQTITISTKTENAAIYYTTDGTTPTDESTLYTEGIVLEEGITTIKAIVKKKGMLTSEVGTATYRIYLPAATPVMTLKTGTYAVSQRVEMTTDTEGAAIYYTLDGTEPTTASTLYTGTPIVIEKDTVVKAIAVKEGMQNSEVAVATYTIRREKAAAPVITPETGTYSTTQSVTITAATEGATIYYTLDGTEPTTASTPYTGTPLVVEKDTVVKAIAVKEEMLNSTVSAATYTIKREKAAAPVITPGTGIYTTAQSVMITTATEGAVIYYTLDGTEPTVSSTRYTGAIQVEKSMTIKAIAVKAEMDNSGAAEAVYTLNIDNPPVEKPFPFTDVAQDNGWKHQSVDHVWKNNIMTGISGTTEFQPDRTLTRAMFATVLYRMAGEPEVVFQDKFSDVVAGKWYSDAIIWANQNTIVDGYQDGSYGINDNITREQIAKMLFQYAKVKGYDISEQKALSEFTDESAVSGWAVGFMQWATAVEMITGKPNDEARTSFRMDPKGNATRAECAAMLMRFQNKYTMKK